MTDLQRKDLSPAWKATKPFLNGGLSGMAATCIIQPIDMVKVRIQIGAKGGPVSIFPPHQTFPPSATQDSCSYCCNDCPFRTSGQPFVVHIALQETQPEDTCHN